MIITDHPEGLLISVRVQPKSSKNAVAGIYGDALKIKLNAPPVDGKANKALVQLLAKVFRCPKSDIEIVSGHSSRNKRLLIHIDNDADFEFRRDALKTILASHL